MGHRFIAGCACVPSRFIIAQHGQAIRCLACNAPMVYEYSDAPQDRVVNQNDIFNEPMTHMKGSFIDITDQSLTAQPVPAKGWKEEDDLAFSKWYNSDEY